MRTFNLHRPPLGRSLPGRQTFMPGGRVHRDAYRGSVLIEASAAIAFLLVPLFLGVAQFGAYYNATNSLSQVAREAGRLTAVWGRADDNPSTPENEASDDYIKERVRAVASTTSLDADQVANSLNISIARADRKQYDRVVVTVSYDLNQKAFFPLYKPGVVTRKSVVMLEK